MARTTARYSEDGGSLISMTSDKINPEEAPFPIPFRSIAITTLPTPMLVSGPAWRTKLRRMVLAGAACNLYINRLVLAQTCFRPNYQWRLCSPGRLDYSRQSVPPTNGEAGRRRGCPLPASWALPKPRSVRPWASGSIAVGCMTVRPTPWAGG